MPEGIRLAFSPKTCDADEQKVKSLNRSNVSLSSADFTFCMFFECFLCKQLANKIVNNVHKNECHDKSWCFSDMYIIRELICK